MQIARMIVDALTFLQPEMEIMGTLKKHGDLLKTQILKKVPMGTRVPKWGPTWEQ